jgi:hypothetical protein
MCFESKFFLFVFSSYPVQIPISVSNVLAEFFRLFFFFLVLPGKLRDSTSFTWRSVCSLPLQYITRRSSHDLTRSYRSYRQQRRQLNKFNVLESTRDDKSFWTDDNKKKNLIFFEATPFLHHFPFNSCHISIQVAWMTAKWKPSQMKNPQIILQNVWRRL